MNTSIRIVRELPRKAHPYLSLLALALSSCSTISDGIGTGLTLATRRPSSFQTTKEQVSITETHPDQGGEAVEFGPENTGRSLELGALAAAFIVEEVEKGVANAAGNYSVIYSGSVVKESLRGVTGFSVIRSINGNENDVASDMQFRFRKSGDAYSLRLTNITLNKAKTAIPLWDDDLDLIVKLELSMLDPKKNENLKVLASEFTVKNLKLGETKEFKQESPGFQTGWFRFPGYTSKQAVPYKLTITVQETSSFYKTAEKGKSLVGEKKKDWTENLAKILSGKAEEDE